MIGLEKSFRLIYSNTHLRTRETLPLRTGFFTFTYVVNEKVKQIQKVIISKKKEEKYM